MIRTGRSDISVLWTRSLPAVHNYGVQIDDAAVTDPGNLQVYLDGIDLIEVLCVGDPPWKGCVSVPLPSTLRLFRPTC